MPPKKSCYWTRKLELELVEFVRQRDFIWKPIGNTNHHIQQKYKAYAEFAARLGHGFTARSVRDRWVNIRSTFNHNLRRVDKSRSAKSPEIYIPCWPLWKPLQFLRESSKKVDNNVDDYETIDCKGDIKEELQSDFEDQLLSIRQRGQRTDRPRHRGRLDLTSRHKRSNKTKCKRVLDDLIRSITPLVGTPLQDTEQPYWFFGKHVTERLNCMRSFDAQAASRDILLLLDEFSNEQTIDMELLVSERDKSVLNKMDGSDSDGDTELHCRTCPQCYK